MTQTDSAAPAPAFAGPISLERLLADQPPVLDVGTNLSEIQAGLRLVVLDDDPGREFGMMRQPGHRFFFSPDEVEPFEYANVPDTA